MVLSGQVGLKKLRIRGRGQRFRPYRGKVTCSYDSVRKLKVCVWFPYFSLINLKERLRKSKKKRERDTDHIKDTKKSRPQVYEKEAIRIK